MKIHEIHSAAVRRARRTIVGRGKGSGRGKTCGRGEKGQKARSGFSVKLGFEGGQMPLVRRMPKRGFSNVAFARKPSIVPLGALNCFPAGEVIDLARLKQLGIVGRGKLAFKVLGSGALKHPLTIHAQGFSRSALEKIEKAGGKAVVVRI
jgi:large subunit ribosomal protein L15